MTDQRRRGLYLRYPRSRHSNPHEETPIYLSPHSVHSETLDLRALLSYTNTNLKLLKSELDLATLEEAKHEDCKACSIPLIRIRTRSFWSRSWNSQPWKEASRVLSGYVIISLYVRAYRFK
jgi:hypothetical protein